jgi:hypothetical protein
MRALVPVGLSALLFLAAPAVAAADVIFDPADADELAAVLAEATSDQNVCYGWDVQVDNAGVSEESIGSNLGAGVEVDSSCPDWVELTAYITWTSESSESEDSASWEVRSSSPDITSADLESLDLDWDSLDGDDPDVVLGKAVTALPLLAADKGIAKPIEAAPETGTAPADAQLTDDPSSDWWRGNGGVLLWGLGLMLAGALFAWWVLRTNRARRRRAMPAAPAEVVVPPYIPDTVPDEFYQRTQDQDLAPAEKPEPPAEPEPEATPDTTPDTTPETPEQRAEPESGESTVESEETPDPERPAPPDQKDKE